MISVHQVLARQQVQELHVTSVAWTQTFLFAYGSFLITATHQLFISPNNKSLHSVFHILMLLFRSFAKPPRAVQMVSECIVILRGYKEISWKSAKGMMSEGNFLKSLTEMDVDGITIGQV